jgi:hypothetical protein
MTGANQYDPRTPPVREGVEARMRFPPALAAVILATSAVPVWAQSDRDPYSGAPLPPRGRETPSPIRDRFYIRGTFYDPQLRTYLRVDQSFAGPGVTGTPVSGERDLGMPSRLRQGRVDFMFRLRERGRLRVDYFEADRSGSQVLAHDVAFSNETFAAGQLMQTSLDWRQFDITYTYSPVRNDHVEVGVGFAVYFLQVDATGAVPAQNQRQEVATATPFPALPLDLTWRIGKRWAVNGRAAYLRVNLSRFRGWYADLEEDVQYRLNPNFALGLGYTSMRTSLTRRGGVNPGVFGMSISGPEAFVRFSF